jgi:hypothetical protein
MIIKKEERVLKIAWQFINITSKIAMFIALKIATQFISFSRKTNNIL